MTKPISSTVHGVLDYMTAGFMCILPRAMGWNRHVTRLLEGSATAATGYSMMTRYELGVVRVLPMKAHLTLDALSGGMLIGAAVLMEEEEPEVRATLGAIGAWEIMAAMLTKTQSGVERKRKLQRAVREMATPTYASSNEGARGRVRVLQGL